MPQKNVFRRIRVPCLLGGMLLCQGYAHAQQRAVAPAATPAPMINPMAAPMGTPGAPGAFGAPGTPGAAMGNQMGAPMGAQMGTQIGAPGAAPGNGTAGSTNAQVLQTWQQNNLGGTTPALVQEGDGTTRLDWHGGVSVDYYNNDVQSADGSVNTPLQSGSFYKTVANSDLRAIRPDGSVDYFQLGVTSSNDPSVLSLNPYQINNLQLGRSTANYHVAVGDIAPNFSSLGSALGVRGVYAQRQFGDMTVHGFAGEVAESWEVLTSTVAANQFLKDVQGFKIEKAFGSNLKTYFTAQAYAEREAPLMAQPASAAPGTSHNVTAGFQYQQNQFALTGETGSSHFEDDGTNNRGGRASIVDTSWRGESLALRAGYHHIDAEYTSLSIAAMPGVQEGYVGGDWVAAPWITFSTDLRQSRNSTLATVNVDATSTSTDSATLRANINFGVDHPGWGVVIQRVDAQTVDATNLTSLHRDISAMLNYATPELMAGIGYGKGKITSDTYPDNNSETENYSLNLGKTFSNARPDLPATWTAGFNFMATSQIQNIVVSGGSSSNVNYTLTLTGQMVGWGSMNLMLTDGLTTQPNGAPGLRMRGFQLDAMLTPGRFGTVKVYLRKTQRNIDDPLLFAQENVVGLQWLYTF